MLISEELIRVAILWHEMWHDGLEEASRLYFGEKNVKGMLAALAPLHQMLERGPQTLKETSFNQVNNIQNALFQKHSILNIIVRFFLQAYARELGEAHEWCKKYQRSSNVKDLTQAWDIYYHVFRRITKQLPQVPISSFIDSSRFVCPVLYRFISGS